VAVIIFLDLTHECKIEKKNFFKECKTSSALLLFIALIKIIEPIEGAQAAQMGLMDTFAIGKEIPKSWRSA
jgi:hypothetical protein